MLPRSNYRIEGWLKVCEDLGEHDFIKDSTWSKSNRITWHAGYVVIRQDERSLICYKNEQFANRSGRNLPRIRLDGGYRSFYRKWGYPTPPPPPARPCVIVVEQQSEEEEEISSDDVHENVTICTTSTRSHSTNLFVKSYTTYDLIESPCIESQSLDRRRGWSARRVMPSTMNVGFTQENHLAIVDSPSTSHKLANFLSRPFRNNPMKRTKSVSKLDRKRSALDPDGTNNWSNSSTLILNNSTNRNANIRNSRSHDSLLSYSTTTHAIDLASGCTVTPLHASVLGTPHCFRINTGARTSKYYACRTAVERDRWIESLRNTMQPNHNFVRRQENSLQLWIFAAKGIPCKRRYYCEVCLDHTLYSRTTSKFKAKDECFWGEHFEINHLPKLESVCVNLYREAERKKKKDRNTLIGYVQIPVSILAARYPVEKWYVVHGAEKGLSKGEVASLRIKARYQTVTILPIRAYDSLLQYLQNDYLTVSSAVENLTSVKSKEDIASCMVRILHKEHLAKDFLCDLVMCEVQALDNYHLMFRGNSLATKAMEAYMKLVGDQYLHDTLSEFIQSVLDCDDDCEVDPSKISNLNLLAKHQELLVNKVHMAWGKIVNSFYDFPAELRNVFYELRQRLEKCGRHELGDYLISSNIFLRFLCPAVLSPSLFNLVQEYPNEKIVRNLTLIAKTVQTLANFTKFGVKEQYMEFMNKFVEGEWEHMRQYLYRISTATNEYFDRENEFWDGNVDTAKELSLLHAYLVESWSSVEEKNVGINLSNLKRILEYINECLRHPSSDAFYSQTPQNNVSASNSCSFNASPTSPTSDYENYNNNECHTSESSMSDDASSSSNSQRLKTILKPSSSHNSSGSSSANSTLIAHRSPANSLNTDDDYVWYTAINENLGLRRTGMVVQQNRLKHVASSPTSHFLNGGGSHEETSLYSNDFRCAKLDSPHDSSSAEEHTLMHGSQTSLVNGPTSSGYQSLNYSTSNSSSPVENNEVTRERKTVEQYKVKSQRTTMPPFPLSIANPLYSLTAVPLLAKEKSCSTLSLPDIQAVNLSQMINGTLSGDCRTYGGTFSPGHCVTPQFMTPQSRRIQLKDVVTVQPINAHALLTHTTSNGVEDSISFGETSLVVSNCNSRSAVLPRTNPRYINTPSSNASGANVAILSRRPVQRIHESQPFVKHIDSVNKDLELKENERFEDLDRSFGIVETNSPVVKEAVSSPTWSEEFKPIINRLRLVEQELEDEHNSSLRKQQIIEVQQKQIEFLQLTNEKLLHQLKETKLTTPAGSPTDEFSVPVTKSRASALSSVASSYETSKNDEQNLRSPIRSTNIGLSLVEPVSPQSSSYDSSSELFVDGLSPTLEYKALPNPSLNNQPAAQLR